jgi:glycosyltransferase involved in cell wall biosynthesis
VSTIHSGIPELVVDGESGYLVAEGDVTGYADRLRRVMGDDGRLGRRGRQRVLEDFDLTRQNALLETIYEDALRPGRTGDPSHR